MKPDGRPVRTIQDIWFTGNRKLSTRRLMDAIDLRAGDGATEAAIAGAQAKIVAAYRAGGSDLSLRVEITPSGANHTNLNFIIDERGSGGTQAGVLRTGERVGGAPPPPAPETRR